MAWLGELRALGTLQTLDDRPTMHFGQSLRNAIFPPWRDHYIDYAKLKKLLRETDGGDSDKERDGEHKEEPDPWTEKDESAFVDELVNVQLEKVNRFQAQTSNTIRERMSQCEAKLDAFVSLADGKTDELSKDLMS